MCCFSGSVDEVSTKIFARLEGDDQFIVYSMNFSADDDLAMVLPIPAARGGSEDPVRFINFEGYSDFFDDLSKLFQRPRARPSMNTDLGLAAAASLEVHRVGAFEASFVPTIADFSRLDRRFRIERRVLRKIPGSKELGFAVFKLRAGREQSVHPMAFRFRTRHPGRLFFPTVHVHDGWTVPKKAYFIHELYCQTDAGLVTWVASDNPTESKVRVAETHGVVSSTLPCYRMPLVGERKNQDIIVDLLGVEALFAAARENDVTAVDNLLAQGVDVDSSDERRRTPLMFARAQTAGALLAAGADVAKGASVLEAVSNGVDGEALTALLAAGADPDLGHWNEWTPLMEAIWRDQSNAVDALLASGADINKKSRDGHTALELSMDVLNKTLVARLLELGVDPNVALPSGETPLIVAVREPEWRHLVGPMVAAGAFLETQGTFQHTPLGFAASSGSTELVRLLLEAGADVNAMNDDGETPLMRAAASQEEGHNHVVALLIEAGANATARDRNGGTALGKAALSGVLSRVRMLFRADPESYTTEDLELAISNAHESVREELSGFLEERRTVSRDR